MFSKLSDWLELRYGLVEPFYVWSLTTWALAGALGVFWSLLFLFWLFELDDKLFLSFLFFFNLFFPFLSDFIYLKSRTVLTHWWNCEWILFAGSSCEENLWFSFIVVFVALLIFNKTYFPFLLFLTFSVCTRATSCWFCWISSSG